MLTLSVVIPAHNAVGTVAACIRALQNQDPHTGSLREIIVVDNNSTDDTAAIARSAGATVIHETVPGAAAARNAGIRAATGDFVCFTDADCEPTADWLHQLTAPLQSDPDLIGAKGTYLTRQKEIVARFVQIEYEDKYDLLRPQKYINFIDTYSAVYVRRVLVENDGFDPHIYYVEDQELSFRLAARGYKMAFQPNAKVYHYHSDTLSKYFRKKFHIAYWKAQVVRRFPTRAANDSHTPQVMKLQMILITLTTAALLSLPLLPLLDNWFPTVPWSWLAIFPLLGLSAFTATTMPFVRKALPKDKQVAAAAPFLLAVRALALSIGYIVGLLRPAPTVTAENETTITGLNYIAKRTLDIIGAACGLLLLGILGPFIAVAVKLDSNGPIIFKQTRIGQEGRPFTIYKFRSMCADAEAKLDRLIDIEHLQTPAFKLREDPRITPIGRQLRRWSLDELPQFWNVLKGDMSLIGPRPEEQRVVAQYNSHHRRRLAIKPGLSGPMQINGRGDLPFEERIRLELEYIENYSLWRDLKILWRTVPAIIRGNGAR